MRRLPTLPRRRLWVALTALAAVLAALALWLGSGREAALAPPSEALAAASQGLDEIFIEAGLNPETRTLSVVQTLRLTSRAQEPRRELVLRTYPNAFSSPETSPIATEDAYDACYPNGFSAGSLTLSEVMVALGNAEATAVAYRYTDAAKTVLSLPLPAAWPLGGSLTVTARYAVALPRAAYRFGVHSDIYALGNAFLIPALWEDGAYRSDPYSPVGDPFFSETANYTVSVTVPQGYVCAASAHPATEERDGKTVYRYTAPAVRDFALTISPRYHSAQAMEGDVLVAAYCADPAQAREALRYAQKALEAFTRLYGPYPYQSLALAELDFPYGGMEYPSMAMLSSQVLAQGGQTLEITVAHEVAHQWWYAVVGSDSILHPWQDEALCEFSVLEYLNDAYGAGKRQERYERVVAPTLRITMPRGVTPGAPLSYFSSMAQYSLLVYGRGAAMLCALDDMMGGGLNGFLRQYYARYAFSSATRADFLALLAQTTGQDYEPLIIDYLDTYIAP